MMVCGLHQLHVHSWMSGLFITLFLPFEEGDCSGNESLPLLTYTPQHLGGIQKGVWKHKYGWISKVDMYM